MDKAAAARLLLTSNKQGVLCTNSANRLGYPFGSVTPYALDARGQPIFLVSSMAVHTKNISVNPKAALLVSAESDQNGLLGGARANLIGVVHPVPEAEIDQVRAEYLKAHPAAGQWVDFGDFGFYRMELAEVYYVGGFGVMGWISADDYVRAGS